MDRYQLICSVAGVSDIGDVDDGYHTFNSLYYQRLVLFATIVNSHKDISWKSRFHEDGSPCFGGGWFIVMMYTPFGQISNHYENEYWDEFNCEEKEVADEWDGHTEKDVIARLMKYNNQN